MHMEHGIMNLKQIVKELYSKELNVSSKYYDSTLKSKYDKASEHLKEMFRALGIMECFFKDARGRWQFPEEDKEFIKWLLKNYTDSNMQAIRGECFFNDPRFMDKILDGVESMLIHLGESEAIIKFQEMNIRVKTNSDEVVLLNKITEKIDESTSFIEKTLEGAEYVGEQEYLEFLFMASQAADYYAEKLAMSWEYAKKEGKKRFNRTNIKMTQDEYRFIFFGCDQYIVDKLLMNPTYWEIKDIIKNCDNENMPMDRSIDELKNDTKRIIEEALVGTNCEYGSLTELMRLACLAPSGLEVTMSGGGGTMISYLVTFGEDIEGWRLII